LIDLETSQFVDFKYNGSSSDSIKFSLVEDREIAAKFKFEENAEKYSGVYKKITGKDCEIVEL
jgi:hypothetical protein